MANRDDMRKNGSGYFDPTAYEAIKNVSRDSMNRTKKRKRLDKKTSKSSYFYITPEGEKGKRKMKEKLLEIVTEEFDEEQARKELAGMEEQFEGKMTDGVGEELGEIVPDPDEPDEEEGGEQ